MTLSAEHVTWNVYMAISETRARTAGTMSRRTAVFVPVSEAFRQTGKALTESLGRTGTTGGVGRERVDEWEVSLSSLDLSMTICRRLAGVLRLGSCARGADSRLKTPVVRAHIVYWRSPS